MTPKPFVAIFFIFLVLELVQESRTESNEDGIDRPKFPLLRRRTKKRARMHHDDENQEGRPPVWKHKIMRIGTDPIFSPGYAALTVELDCAVKGYPRPKITWFRQNDEITSPKQRL